MTQTSEVKCTRKFKSGWKCIVGPHESNSEPCGLIPRWWNFRDRWRFRDNL